MTRVICDEYYECAGCKWKYADKYDDIDEEYRHCTHLIEVAEVKHGHNLSNTPSYFVCSLCGDNCCDVYTWEPSQFNYCPNCGAKMDARNIKQSGK